MPVVEKFVRVTNEEGTKVYWSSDPNSPWLVTWVEDIESDMADIVDKWSDEVVPDGYLSDDNLAWGGMVLAVLGEERGCYKVSIRNERCDKEIGYVKKEDVEDVEPEKVTEEVLEEVDDEFEWVTLRVVKEGKYKGLVLRVLQDELNGETLDVGVLFNGLLAFPENSKEFIEFSPEVQELTFQNPKAGEFPVYFKYPKSMAFWIEEEGYSTGFNPDSLTDEQIAKIVEDMMKRKGVFVRYDYLIPMTEGGLMTFWLKSK